MMPCAIVTDRLASYAAAKAVVMPSVSHLRGWRQNNRVENSHQPVRQRSLSQREVSAVTSVLITSCSTPWCSASREQLDNAVERVKR